jgi:predicted AlkP superfamily pyrophosphatase or phosphodiesterase
MRGPSGTGLTVGYFPEIQSIKNDVKNTIAYDSLHVGAWLDWIDGVTPVNTTTYGAETLGGSTPTLFGGNFQSVSVAQKTVGYNNDTTSSLSAALLEAMDFVDASFGKVVAKLKSKKLLASSLIIVASKHGQAPIKRSKWSKVDPDALMNATGVPTAWITVSVNSINQRCSETNCIFRPTTLP